MRGARGLSEELKPFRASVSESETIPKSITVLILSQSQTSNKNTQILTTSPILSCLEGPRVARE